MQTSGDNVRAAIEELRDKDPQNRAHAVLWLSLGRYDQEDYAYMVVPALIDALNDPNADVRSDAVEVLGRYDREALGGRYAIAKTSVLILALKNQDPALRRTAAMVFGAIGKHQGLDFNGRLIADTADINVIIPALIDTLNDRDAGVRDMTADALRGYDEEAMGPNAREKTATFILALKSQDPAVRVTAAWGLGTIGPHASLAVPTLVGNLAAQDSCTRLSAVWALGRMGPNAARALPALVVALRDGAPEGRECIWPRSYSFAALMTAPNSHAIDLATRKPNDHAGYFDLFKTRDFAADALVRIADASRDAQRTEIIGLLNEAATGLEDNSFASDAKQVRTDIAVLESIRRGQWGDRLVNEIGKFPKTSALVMVYVFWAVLCLGFLLKSPLVLLRINEKLAPLPRVKLPLWLGGMEISLTHLFLVGFFQYHSRVLDAWVSKRIVKARDRFGRTATVAQREVYVDTPVELDRTFTAALKPEELREAFNRKRSCILVSGEGGSGKTSLACRIATWVMSEDEATRLSVPRMLPVMIEQDLDLEVEKDKSILIEVIRGQLKDLTDDDEAPRQELVGHLLKQKRVLLIVDGLSELSEATRSKVRPLDPEFAANALIVTSRLDEQLDGIVKTTIHPIRIQGNRLSSFMEAYLSQCGKRALFSDSEFFEGCKLLSTMVGERDATVLLAKLFAEQMIDARQDAPDKNLPRSIPDLMLEYLNLLNRRHPEMDDRTLHEAVKRIAWECLRQTCRPAPAQVGLVLEALGENAKPILDFLEHELRLIETLGAARDRIRFALDPLAEYLAGLYLVERYASDGDAWRELLVLVDSVPGAPQTSREFLLAVRDCCLTMDEDLKIPGFVKEQLATLTGLAN